MARRPVFAPEPDGHRLVRETLVDFEWHPGFSVVQKQRSIRALHEAARRSQRHDASLKFRPRATSHSGANSAHSSCKRPCQTIALVPAWRLHSKRPRYSWTATTARSSLKSTATVTRETSSESCARGSRSPWSISDSVPRSGRWNRNPHSMTGFTSEHFVSTNEAAKSSERSRSTTRSRISNSIRENRATARLDPARSSRPSPGGPCSIRRRHVACS